MPVRWLLVLVMATSAFALEPEILQALDESRYVYIASTRKDGSLGTPAEIWFFHRDGDVYVATPPGTWRARRIRAGRPGARIWVGKPDGASFDAVGEIVEDPSIEKALMEAFARKYGEQWQRWTDAFRKGFEDGSRVVVRYSPAAARDASGRLPPAAPADRTDTGLAANG